MQTDFSDDIGLSTVLEKTISCMERTLTVREENWDEDANLTLKHCEESGHHCVQLRNLEEEWRKIYDSFHNGFGKYEASTSHNSHRKSDQYLWSSIELV